MNTNFFVFLRNLFWLLLDKFVVIKILEFHVRYFFFYTAPKISNNKLVADVATNNPEILGVFKVEKACDGF
jgi:hypothetical protein